MGEPEGHSRALRVGPKCQAPLTLTCPEALQHLSHFIMLSSLCLQSSLMATGLEIALNISKDFISTSGISVIVSISQEIGSRNKARVLDHLTREENLCFQYPHEVLD